MASGILGQVIPTALANTLVYTVPANKLASFSILVCNKSGVAVNTRIAISTSSSTPDGKDYIEYESAIPGNGVLERTALVANSGMNVVVYAGSGNTAVTVLGFEDAA